MNIRAWAWHALDFVFMHVYTHTHTEASTSSNAISAVTLTKRASFVPVDVPGKPN
jgi:hypothetical protein